jgi:hypothetical protein
VEEKSCFFTVRAFQRPGAAHTYQRCCGCWVKHKYPFAPSSILHVEERVKIRLDKGSHFIPGRRANYVKLK